MAAKKYISQNGEIQFANASEIYQKELARNQISASRSECVCVCAVPGDLYPCTTLT